MGKGLPKVFFPADMLDGSGLCGALNWTTHSQILSGGSASLRPGALGLGVGVFVAALTAGFVGLL